MVFLVFLYQVGGLCSNAEDRSNLEPQRWIYRVDPERINEYGQVGEETKALEDKKK